MNLNDYLTVVGFALALLHFCVPILYYEYARTRWLPLPWNIAMRVTHDPRISVVIPAYNEEAFIETKLDNVLAEDYPHDLLEVIVVDPASTDNTAELASRWAKNHEELSVRVITEPENKGKLNSLLHAFARLSPLSSIVVTTDADVRWETGALRKVMKYLSDPNVGAVTSTLVFATNVPIETHYREFFNLLRIAESKRHSTPIQAGGFQALSIKVLKEIGVPTFAGSDDSAFGSYFALAGFRSIQADDILVREPMRGSQISVKVRRAQSLNVNFLRTKAFAKVRGVYRRTEFERIWKMEWWLIIVNPWILIASIASLILSMTQGLNPLPMMLLAAGAVFFLFNPYRVWVSQQVYLILGSISNLISKPAVWRMKEATQA